MSKSMQFVAEGFLHKTRFGKYFSPLYALIFFLTFPAAVVTYYFGKHTIHLFMALSVFVAASHYRAYILLNPGEKKLARFTVLIFCYIAVSGYLLQSDINSRFWPSLEAQLSWLLPLFVLMSLYSGQLRVTMNSFKSAIAVAAITAGVATLFNFVMNLDRGHLLHSQPIVFGDLSLLFGLLSFLFFVEETNRRMRLLYSAASVLGMTASLYSGSRGGWIGLPMVFWLFWRWRFISRREWLVIGFGIVLLGLFVALTDNSIKTRLLLIGYDIQSLLEGDSSTSLGQRFEMWKVAFRGIAEHPFFGNGLGEFYAYKESIIAAGDAPEHILRYQSPHNEYLNIVFSNGIVGIITYVAFFAWLWRFFSKASLSVAEDRRAIGRIGQLLMVAYADFCLSEVMLSTRLGGPIFFILCALLFYFLGRIEKTELTTAPQT